MVTDNPLSVRSPSIPEAVAVRLREAILAGTLRPGDRLVEQKLAARFGIGQPTIREALRELEIEGFVRRYPARKGTHVTELNHQDYCKILDVRIALESLAVERAASRLDDGALGQIEETVNGLAAAAAVQDLAAFHKSDIAFHQGIWSLAGNEYLAQTLERLTFGLFAFVLLDVRRSGRLHLQPAVGQHRGILAALASGDGALARSTFVAITVRFWKEQYGIEPGAAAQPPGSEFGNL